MGTNKAAATKRSLHFENSWNSGGTTLTCFGNAVNTKGLHSGFAREAVNRNEIHDDTGSRHQI